MKSFTVYQSNGMILRTGQCIDSDYASQAGSGEILIDIASDPRTQYVDNNQLVNFPPKPDYECSFDYDTKQWVGDTSKQEISIISQRNAKLYSSDWTQIPNNPLTPEVQQQWADYRQQLRDITNQSGYPFNVVWPTQPE